MSDLTTAMIIQILFSVVVFAFLFYLMSKNSDLKKEIESKKNNSNNISSGD